jgi:multiple sugar transport system substrate-binding protein
MVPEQRDALDEIIVKIRSGRVKRRTFLARATALGLSSTAAASLLEACGGASNSPGGGQTTNIVWQSENDPSGTYQNIVDNYNKTNKDGIHVMWRNGPSSTDQMLTIYDNMLRARSGNIDVMSIDVVYPASFASQGWSVPLDDKWPASDRANYLSGPLKSCTYNGKIVAAPFRSDIQMIYYRKDIVSTPPKSWEELTSMAKSNSGKAKYGFVWQGSQYEGLICDFSEVLYGYGGSILDPNNTKSVTVTSPQGVQALTQMVLVSSMVAAIQAGILPLVVGIWQSMPFPRIPMHHGNLFSTCWGRMCRKRRRLVLPGHPR